MGYYSVKYNFSLVKKISTCSAIKGSKYPQMQTILL